MSVMSFLQNLSSTKLTALERVIALLWYHGLEDPASRITLRQLCGETERAGYPRPHVTRLTNALKRDRRVTSGPKGSFRIAIARRGELDERYAQFTTARPIAASDSVIPAEMFDGTRGYLEQVVRQINASYDGSLYDCCAVMCRRLLETLIIEAYESKGYEDDLKGNDGHYMMFSGLLSVIDTEKRFSLGRNSKSALRSFKQLGDLSAHNRRFNARQNDITRIAPGLRVVSEELLHLAGLL